MRAVYFPSSIDSRTVLDGFAIDGPPAASAAGYDGVTIEGARNVLLSNMKVLYGVKALDAAARIFRSSIRDDANDGITVHAINSEVILDDNCQTPPDAVTGRCVANCAIDGPALWTGYFGNGIVFENSPGSKVQRSSICGTSRSPAGSRVVRVSGDARGTLLFANDIRANAGNGNSFVASIELSACGGSAPWLAVNSIKSDDFGSGPLIDVSGACHPVIESNPLLRARFSPSLSANEVFAIRCNAENLRGVDA